MDCHGGAAVSQALGANIVHGHLPQMGLEDEGLGAHHHEDPMVMMGGGGASSAWADDFAQHHLQHHHHHQGDAAEGDWAAQFDPMAAEYLAMEAQREHDLVAAEGAAAAAAAEAETAGDWTAQFHNQEGEEWAKDYNNDDVQVFTVPGEAPLSVEEKSRQSGFYELMRRVRTGEVKIDEDAGVVRACTSGEPTDAAAEMLNEYANGAGGGMTLEEMAAHHAALAGGDLDEDNELMDEDEATEFLRGLREAEGGALEGGGAAAWGSDDGELLEQYYRQQRDMADEYLDGEDADNGEEWLAEYNNLTRRFEDAQNSTDYPFDTNNPYLFHDNPFDEGLQLLAVGNLAEAVLAFEAVCQKEPERVEGWQYLGTTQAENEKDNLAIRALNKARQLSPANLAVLMALSVSHTNETNHAQALQSLRAWVLAHQEYEALGSVPMDPISTSEVADEADFAREYLFVSASEHRAVCNLFQAALEINPADAELHAGLGILHNLSHEYELAAEDFRAALKLRPTDEKLWNKLGATLANGNRSEAALEAYDRALDINPGYVRAQYNLGIAHSNLGAHQTAAKQFLRAIVMQQGGVEVPDPPTRSTKEIWDVLRMTFSLMERPDLVEKTWAQNVGIFLSEFDLQDLAN